MHGKGKLMIEVASLNLAIDTSRVRIATGDLKAWSAEAGRAEKATGATARSMKSMGDNAAATGGVIARVGKMVDGFDAKLKRTNDGMRGQLMVAAAAAPSSSIAANRVTLDRPTGSSAFDTILEKGSQTGEPLLKSDLQKAGENLQFFSNLLGGFVKDWRIKIAKMAADAAFEKVLQGTDFNELAAADAKLQERKKYWNDRVAENGNDLPQAKIEAAIANERARVSGIIYGARKDINDKQQSAGGLFDDFYKKYEYILHLASLSSMFPDGNLTEISGPLAALQSSLEKNTATTDQVQKLTAAIDEVMRKPENAYMTEPLQSLSNDWKTYSPKITDELEASQNFASQARSAYASLLTAGGQVGVDGGSTKSAAQNQGSLQSNGLSQGVNGIITEFSTLLPKAILSVARSLPSILPEGIRGNTDSSAKDNARINSQEKLQKSTSSLTSTGITVTVH